MKQIGGMWFPDGDEHFSAQIAANPVVDGKGTYQFRKYRAALDCVAERKVAVDIGAHVGLWSRLMAADFETVAAFEPMPDHIACFHRNLIGVGNIEFHPVALSDKAGKLNIYMPRDNTGHSHVSDAGIPCQARRLDEFGFQRIDFMKIDVEGWELPVVTGGRATIRRTAPIIIIEQKPNGNAERYGYQRTAAVEALKAMGFEVVVEIGGDFIMKPQFAKVPA